MKAKIHKHIQIILFLFQNISFCLSKKKQHSHLNLGFSPISIADSVLTKI